MQIVSMIPMMIVFSPTTLRLLMFLVILVVVVVVLALFLPWLRDFRRELRYINKEIGRTDGREREHWKKKKKRLWLSLLPFYHYH